MSSNTEQLLNRILELCDIAGEDAGQSLYEIDAAIKEYRATTSTPDSVEECEHLPTIDTGVGADYCPACRRYLPAPSKSIENAAREYADKQGAMSNISLPPYNIIP